MLKRIRNNGLRQLILVAMEQGWDVGQTNSNHLFLQSPKGKKIFTSGTPSDNRTVHNLKALLRCNGLKV